MMVSYLCVFLRPFWWTLAVQWRPVPTPPRAPATKWARILILRALNRPQPSAMYVTQSIYFVKWKRKTTDFKENHNANWWECPISFPHCPVVVMVMFFWSKPKLFLLPFVLNVGEVKYLTNSLIDMDNICVWFKMWGLSEEKRKT